MGGFENRPTVPFVLFAVRIDIKSYVAPLVGVVNAWFGEGSVE